VPDRAGLVAGRLSQCLPGAGRRGLGQRGDRRPADPGVGVGQVGLELRQGRLRLREPQQFQDLRRPRRRRGGGRPVLAGPAAPNVRRPGDEDHLAGIPGGNVELADRHDVAADRPLEELGVPVGAAAYVQVPEPLRVVAAGMVGAIVVQAPSAFRPGQ
jgi:hypothetical protein